LLAQIDNRFDRVDDKVTKVSDQMMDLRVAISGQSSDIKALVESSHGDRMKEPDAARARVAR
jgi:hypothetical protein